MAGNVKTTSSVMTVTLDQVWAYARCPYEYWWRYVARIVPPLTARNLVEEVLRRALRAYYVGEVQDVLEGIGWAWQSLLAEWGCADEVWPLLVEFATRRTQVLEPFRSGRIVKRDGSPYRVPEMSNEYRRRARKAGLPRILARLGELLADVPVRVDEEYGIPQAFSDSAEMAERNRWPPVNAVTGVEVPFEVPLTERMAVIGKGDLVIGKGKVEVHDYERRLCPPAVLIRRDLRVVAALNGFLGEDRAEIRHVVYRHLPSGTAVTVSRWADPGRLLLAVIAVGEGIRHRVYVPRLAACPLECPSCPYYELCTADRQDVLDTLAPTLVGSVAAGRQQPAEAFETRG